MGSVTRRGPPEDGALMSQLPPIRSAASIAGVVFAACVVLAGGRAAGGGNLPSYAPPAMPQNGPANAGVDTALVVSVDVSSSVDERRYRLQLEGIASALEDPAVLSAILAGPKSGILFSVVTWADRPKLSVPWMRIASKAEATAAALKVRAIPREGGEFTCVSKMLRFVSDKIVPQIPARALKVVVDVSGDGSDNCNPEEAVKAVRDDLVSRAITVNGLPILEGREAATLEGWYRDNVMGGPGSFILAAEGYEDFGRAIRQKFVVEISAAPPVERHAGGVGRR